MKVYSKIKYTKKINKLLQLNIYKIEGGDLFQHLKLNYYFKEEKVKFYAA